jgi:gliding motility-associated-like protein
MKRNSRCLLALCLALLFLNYGQGQAIPFISHDIFQTGYFIENHGQYKQYATEKKPVLFGIDNNSDHIYFHPSGFTMVLSKTVKDENNKHENEEGAGRIIETLIAFEWLGANRECNIEGIRKSKHYFSYGDPQFQSYGFEKIIYHDLYPGIDLEYIIPEKGGVKYSLIIRPGGDLSKVKLMYSGDHVKASLTSDSSIIIHNAIEDIMESGLVAHYGDQASVEIKYTIKGNIIGFKPEKEYDHSQTLTIDPWVANITTLTATGNGSNKGYDVDYDIAGNLYVYGAGRTGSSASAENMKVAKYNTSGTILWTFNGAVPSVSWQSKGDVGYMGNFVVDKSSGKVYIGQGFVGSGTQIVRLTTNAVYDTFISTKDVDFQEIWEMNFNCKTGTVFGMGGGTTSNINFGEISSTGAFNLKNITGYNFTSQDILSSTLNQDNDMFVIFPGVIPPALIDNHIMKLNKAYTSKVWDISCGYNNFMELYQKPYITNSVNSNGFNALAANSDYLFYYDGYNLKAFNVSNGTQAGNAITIGGQTPKFQGGIYADACNNVYIGCLNGRIKGYNFDGTTFNPIAGFNFNSAAVYDIKFNIANGSFYVSGDGFVATAKGSVSCGDYSFKSNLIVSCGKAVVSVSDADTVANFQYTWYDSTSATIIRKVFYTNATHDSVSTLTSNHKYALTIIKEPLCGLAGVTLPFVLPCAKVDTFICDANPIRIINKWYNVAGVFKDTLKSINNTDSIVTISITQRYKSSSQLSAEICQGDTLKIGKHKYISGGIYTDTLVNNGGCDSILTTTLTVKTKTAYPVISTICQGDTFRFGKYQYFTSGIYKDTLKYSTGCDSVIITLQLTVAPKKNTSLTLKVCPDDSITVGSHKYFQPGLYIDTLKTYLSCDSIITLTVQHITSSNLTLTPSICAGDTFHFNSHTYYIAGSYTDTVKAKKGCDSIIAQITLKTLSPSHDTISANLCEGDTFRIGVHKYFTNGIYTDHFVNTSGCDSVITSIITITNRIRKNIIYTICYGDSLKIGNRYYKRSGYYSDTLKKIACDTILNIHLNVSGEPTFRIVKDTFVCEFRNGSVELKVPGYGSYLWAPGGEKTQAITVSKAGKYICYGDDGVFCRFSDTFNIANYCGTEVIIPSAFSPDGNGVNDFFLPSSEFLTDYNMKIYNRWGELLFESNDLEKGWDGNYLNEAAQEGVYIYIIRVVGIDHKQLSRKGTFTLVR